MTLQEAQEHIKRHGEFKPAHIVHAHAWHTAIATILNAVVKGELRYEQR